MHSIDDFAGVSIPPERGRIPPEEARYSTWRKRFMLWAEGELLLQVAPGLIARDLVNAVGELAGLEFNTPP